MKLLISGGHPSPALAVIDAIQSTYPEIEIAFIGRVVAQHATGQLASEAEAVKDRSIPFYSIETAKWGTTIWQKMTALCSMVGATVRTYQLLHTVKPDLFLSFGSYVAVPVALACMLRGIPVITHEQTRVAGISNRVIAKWAAVVAISYPESAQFFPKQKTVVTGLPLRPQLFAEKVFPPTWLNRHFLASELPILYITGGSTGSTAINELVASALPELVKDWRIIHPCGKAHNHHHWYKRLLEEKERLPAQNRDRYQVVEQVTVMELAWIYRQRTLVLGRSGANTTAEVAAFHVPAIFIPLPLSNFDEQHKNAHALEKEGSVVVIDQSQLTVARVLSLLDQFSPKLATSREGQEFPHDPAACNALINLVITTHQAHSPS